ncbi:unnamed protein product [Cuscuta epithymum]|uniref:NAB domain-containing protein n=1 Tax=Cuscuta epithymum TaxID=186058 RepID=A0AAV0FY72_9ASTE|nr:unnamed protein product [Cuscuta epithymum]
MSKLSHADSRRMYSWWWDSHISPKNSKWLQENLTDMDSKVKAMIKVIEEDADSFARRAEMYYKKRPELMKLVEEFYRAYRALAERYDHATGVIQHAHKTMPEAFPNQVPMGDYDSPISSTPDPQTPNSTARSLFESDDELQSSDPKRNGLKQINNLFGSKGNNVKFGDGKVRKGLNFHELEEKERRAQTNKANRPDLDQDFESEETLRKAQRAQVEDEKVAGRIQYQQGLEKSSGLNSSISHAEEEVQTLKDAISKLEAEKEANLLEYRLCLEKVSDLESRLSQSQEDTMVLSHRATTAELEAQSLKDDLEKIAAEKDKALDQYVQSLQMIAKLENKLQSALEDSTMLKERVERAEREVETLKNDLGKIAIEKDKALEMIDKLENMLRSAEQDSRILKERAEREVEALTQKTVNQTQELAEKQQELGRLWRCIQEERLRFIEAETAFQTLQHLHSQVQEELRLATSELRTDNQRLEDEVLKVKEENKNLEEVNVSSSMMISNMQEEISSLSETKWKLEQEVELRVDQRNALQQELYCLKEELNVLNQKYLSVLDQVKELQDEITNLKGTFQKEKSEKEGLLEKLMLFDQLVEKNSIMENSLSDLRVDFEAISGKAMVLESSCQSLLEEKSTLLSDNATLTNELLVTNENLEKLSAKNTVLENSLIDAHDELQTWKETSKGLEDSCQILTNEKSDLLGEQERLLNQLQTALLRLGNLEKMYSDIQQRYSVLEKEKEELNISLDREKNDHTNFVQTSNKQLAGMESENLLLQEECQLRANENDEERDRAFDYQLQIFILQKCAQDLEEKIFSLLTKYHNLVLGLEQRNEEENHQNFVENCVLVTLLSQLKLEGEKLNSEKATIENEYMNKSNQLCILQSEAIKIQEENEEMKSKIKVKDHKEKLLELDIENLGSKLMNFQRVNFGLQEEKTSMGKEISLLEEETVAIYSEILSLKILSMVFKNCTNEKFLELKMLYDDLDRLNETNSEKLSLAERILKELKFENLNLMKALQRSEDELNATRLVKIQLDHDIDVKNNAMSEKEQKIVDIEQKLSLVENENLEAKKTKEDLKMQILSLSEDNNFLITENGKVKEKNEEFQKQITEIQTLESETEGLFGELQISSSFHSLYEQKVHELLKVIENLEDRITSKDVDVAFLKERLSIVDAVNEGLKIQLATSESEMEDLFGELQVSTISHDLYEKKFHELMNVSNTFEAESTSKDVEIKLLKERVNFLEAQKEDLETQHATLESEAEELFGELLISMVCHCLFEQKVYEPMKVSTTFEAESTSKDIDIKILSSENEELKAQLETCRPVIVSLIQCISSLEKHAYGRFLTPHNNDVTEVTEVAKHYNSDGEKNVTKTDAFVDLQDLATRIRSVEKLLLKVEQLEVADNLSMNARLQAVMKQVEDLKTENSVLRRNTNRRSEILPEGENGVLTKDIMLDQISEASPYNMTKREQHEADNQILELWETTNTEGDTQEYVKLMKLPKNEKELRMDILEHSRRSSDLHDGNTKIVLERLNSDILKLTNLQITVLELKKKLEIIQNSNRRGKSVVELENLKVQLSEAEASIQRLFDRSEKVKKNFESGSLSEQAKRISEKIGRLHFEVQRIQFVLVKYDGGKESKGRSSKAVSEGKRTVLLRDYMYGAGVKPSHKRKKKRFCSCIQPHTYDD